MTKEESKISLDKIFEAMKVGVAKVYSDAYRDGTELVISKKPGEVQVVKVTSDGTLAVVREMTSGI
ncbi:hypothetical protein BH10BAC1_BH10BAC1_05500 [soil metagenome]